MKPPLRTRSAPARYEVCSGLQKAGPLRLTWSAREKLALLRGLKSQNDKKEPQPTVHGRSQGEISSYISWLRGRAAREAVQTEYERWVQQRRTRDCRSPAPIELWTDSACRMSHPTEEAVTAAFSQMLTIAATEPLSLQHSVPCKTPKSKANKGPTRNQGSTPPRSLESSGQQTGSSETEPATAQDGTTAELKGLDFEKIYKYLSKSARGEDLPKLSDVESAVILRLLHCLPDQLRTLDCQSLQNYLRDTYSRLNSSPDAQEGATLAEADSEQQSSWLKDFGFCPLNPFLIPLQLLRGKDPD